MHEAPRTATLKVDTIEALSLGEVSFWLRDGNSDNYNIINQQMDDGLFDMSLLVGIYIPSIMPMPASSTDYDSPVIWNNGRKVIARYRRLNGGLEIATDADGMKVVELLVLPWSNNGLVAKELLMVGNNFAPVLRISDWRKVHFKKEFRENELGEEIGVLRKSRLAERALARHEKIWVQD